MSGFVEIGPGWLDLAVGAMASATLRGTAVLAAGAIVEPFVESATGRHAVVLSTAAAVVGTTSFSLWRPAGLDLPDAVSAVIVATWCAGAVAVLVPLAASWLTLRRSARNGTPLGARGRATVAIAAVPVPLTLGALRPVILPVDAPRWTLAALDATLTHEHAHVARLDWLTNVGLYALCAGFGFHPLAWRLRRRGGLAAELACDERVLGTGIRPSAYARHLLERATARSPIAATSATSQLTERIHAILGPRPNRRGWGAPLALGVLVLTIAALTSWAEVMPAPVAPAIVQTCEPT